MIIQCPEIIQVAKAQQTAGYEVEDSGKPFAHIHTMDTEKSEKRKQQPGNGIIYGAGSEPQVCLTVQRWDQKKINDPANEKKAESKKIDGSHKRFSIIESMGTCKTKDPEYVAYCLTMGILITGHAP